MLVSYKKRLLFYFIAYTNALTVNVKHFGFVFYSIKHINVVYFMLDNKCKELLGVSDRYIEKTNLQSILFGK